MEDILTMKVICPVKNQETFVMVHGWESKEGGRHIGVDKRKLYWMTLESLAGSDLCYGIRSVRIQGSLGTLPYLFN